MALILKRCETSRWVSGISQAGQDPGELWEERRKW